MSRRLRPDLKPGRVPGAGISIIRIIKAAPQATKTRYLALYECCGREGEITGHSIDERLRNSSRTCAKCGNYSRERQIGDQRLSPPDYGVTPPDWPVPGKTCDESK